jgi:hypothetical protein
MHHGRIVIARQPVYEVVGLVVETGVRRGLGSGRLQFVVGYVTQPRLSERKV